MNDKVEFIDYRESLSVKVGEFILSKGFDLASAGGEGFAGCMLSQSDSLGILRKDSDAEPRKYLFGLIAKKPRREFLGVVWFSNSVRGANETSWVFEAYGRKHIELVRQLAEEMASTFNTKISLRLVREQPRVETYLSDYGL